MSNKYETREAVYVTPFTGSTIKYGFLTNTKEAEQTALGQTTIDFTAALPTGLCFGANAPKPGRASKVTATQSVSSYYSIAKAGTLKADGWRLSRPFIRRGGITSKTVGVYVTLNGIKYAWMMPTETYNKIESDLAGLGIELADANDKDLVWGASSPKPPKGSKVVDTNIISTFVDPTKANSLPTGWSLSGKEYV